MIIIYRDFAYLYDRLMQDIDYVQWTDYICSIFKKQGADPRLIVDLGCGTGSFCMEMTKKGYEMIGIDMSSEMLSCAKQKAIGEGMDILFLNQDMTRFELYGTVDAITCLLDSVNYVTFKRDLRRLFKLAANYLNPKGLFVFDINSPYKFEHILSSNVFCETDPEVSYIWQNSFDKKSKLCRFDLTFFFKEGEQYSRADEVHYERCYEMGELVEMLTSAGLSVCHVYEEFQFHKPSVNCERIFFVCQKVG